jgi:cell pole-organizing protein PopZ
MGKHIQGALMANEAHKEPTMEEILASIRKIISDDASAPAKAPKPEPEISHDDEDDVGFEDVMFDDDLDEVALEEESFGDVAEPETVEFEIEDFSTEEEYVPEEAVEPAPEPVESFESLLSASRSAESAPEPEPQSIPQPAAVAPTHAPKEKAVSASPAYEQTVLTDDSTANAAAGSLGKLISKMDLGGDTTLEGLVRELLRPMIKEWLDAHLAALVEEKVEAEVQRISRMAR